MKTFSDRIKGIFYFLVVFIICQSCSVYKKNPSTIEEATAKTNTRIKLTTKDGEEYRFRWIEEEDGYVYSILNTKRIYVKKKRLAKTPAIHYRFIESRDEGEYVRGIIMTKKDTVTLLIPIEQIDEIKLIDHYKTSCLRTFLITFGALTITIALIINNNL